MQRRASLSAWASPTIANRGTDGHIRGNAVRCFKEASLTPRILLLLPWMASALNDAVRYWKNTRLWFNEGSLLRPWLRMTRRFPLPSLFSFRPMKAALLSSHTPDRGILLRRFQGLNMTLLGDLDLWASLRLCLCWWVLRLIQRQTRHTRSLSDI